MNDQKENGPSTRDTDRTHEQGTTDMAGKGQGVDREGAEESSQPGPDSVLPNKPAAAKDAALHVAFTKGPQDDPDFQTNVRRSPDTPAATEHILLGEGQNKNERQDNELLVELNQYFEKVAGSNPMISKADFQKALGYKNPYMADRFFAMFDCEGAGCVERGVLLDGIARLTEGSATHKLNFLFDMIDDERRGYLEAEQLRTLLCSCMDESCLKLTEDDVEDLTMALLESADKDETEALTFDELVQLLDRHPGIMENLTFSMARWLTSGSSSKQTKERGPSLSFPFNKRYFQNNVSSTVFAVIYILINIGLFTLSAVRYRTGTWCLIIARGCGMCLNFNSAFIVVPMLRYTLTWVRTTKLASLLPLDHTVYIHKVVGVVIMVHAATHTLAHLGNLGYVVTDTVENGTEPLKYWEYLFTAKSRPVVGDLSGITGVVLCVILGLMMACSLPCVRRAGHFEVGWQIILMFY